MASPMQPGGASDGWLQQKANQLVIGDQCLAWLPDKEIKKLAGEKWALMPESVANQPQIYQWLATFLASGYKIPAGRRNAGKNLDEDTAMGVWGGLIRQAHHRFSQGGMTEASRVRA